MLEQTQYIDAGKYKVYAGNTVFRVLSNFICENHHQSKIFILADENTLNHCVPLAVSSVNELKEARFIEIKSGEENKNLKNCEAVWKTLSELGADRNSLLVNIGGGIVSDMGGFIASAFKRGIAFINVPTTLLSQADASVGGKVGIDLDHLKNEIGFFSDPAAVFIFPGFLRTTTDEHKRSGFSEILKMALISDSKLWEQVKTMDPLKDDLAEVIVHSVRLKNEIVNQDPLEKGLRKILNFGHTVAHAIEGYFLRESRPILHGEAVAAGLICESWLSNKKGFLNGSDLEEIKTTVNRVFPSKLDFNIAEVVNLMSHDKKNLKGNINFTLIKGIGSSIYDQNFETSEILESIKFYQEEP